MAESRNCENKEDNRSKSAIVSVDSSNDVDQETLTGHSLDLYHDETLPKRILVQSGNQDRDEAVNALLGVLHKAIDLSNDATESLEIKFSHALDKVQFLSVMDFIDLVKTITLRTSSLNLAHTLLQVCDRKAVHLVGAGHVPMNQWMDRMSIITNLTKDLIGASLDHIHRVSIIENSSIAPTVSTHQTASEDYGSKKSASDEEDSSSEQAFREWSSLAQLTQETILRRSRNTQINSFKLGSGTMQCLLRSTSHYQGLAPKSICYRSYLAIEARFEAVKRFYGGQGPHFSFSKIFGDSMVTGDDLTSRTMLVTHIDAGRQSTDKPLDSHHHKAVQAALTTPITLIWGPPGTGKTRTILEILRRMLPSFEIARCLVVAPKAHSVDDLFERFVAQSQFERTKVMAIRAGMNDCDTPFETSSLKADILADMNSNDKSRIQESRFVFATCVEAGLGLLRGETFETVIIDEAAWQSEIETLIPLTKGCQRLILAGDHMQYTGLIRTCEKVEEQYIPSFFERYWTFCKSLPDRYSTVMLGTQYSMHPDLCEFLSSSFYQCRLQSAYTLDRHKTPSTCVCWPPSGGRMLFVQHSNHEHRNPWQTTDLNSRHELICKDVLKAFQCRETLCDCRRTELGHADDYPSGRLSAAVLTPYNGQADTLKTSISEHAVSTVESYQGPTKDVVILSMVRDDDSQDVETLEDMRMLNVAVAWAKEVFVVIGDRTEILADRISHNAKSKRIWKALLSRCTELSLNTGTSSGIEDG